MDTRLKKLNKFTIQKVIVYFLTLILFTSFIVGAIDLMSSATETSIVPEYDYLYSDEFRRRTESVVEGLKDYIYYYKNEANIKKGNFSNNPNSDYRKRVDELFYEFTSNKNYFLGDGNEYINYETGDGKTEGEMRSIFEKEKKAELDRLRTEEINRELSRYENIKRWEKSIDPKEIIFYASNGQDKISNTSMKSINDYKNHSVYFIVDRDGVKIANDRAEKNLQAMKYGKVYNDLVEVPRYAENDYRIYLAFDDNYLQTKMDSWKLGRKDWERKVQILAVITFGFILALVRLIYITGRDDNGGTKLSFIDKLYTDINVILCLFVMSLWFEFMQNYHINYLDINLWSINSLSVVTFTLGGIGLALVLSLVRHIKDGSIITHSLVYKVFNGIFLFFKRIYDSGSTSKKAVALLILYPIILALTIFIFPITIGLAIVLALRKVEEFNKVREGVKKIREGDLDYKIQIERSKSLKELAEDINDIGEGLKNSVDNELTSERHRTELITNVSHDIRTPLTSIITYVDLLKYEKDEEKRREYIGILDQKSNRLKKLIDDLFEASKVSSGSVPVNLSKINITSLITQGIGEVNDKIEERKLEFIIDHPREELYVMADGDLLWRAIENLLSNIFKYGLVGSRVYIDIKDDEDNILLIIKNISAYKLNISETELMERFKRGDESRTSEGSGLGLSIAESLIKLQKGKFFIEIDGDLFKTTMVLPKP